jgi:fimbrial isopeptide formation D2 family protein/LPXTG-motif cell wall-anchored protein
MKASTMKKTWAALVALIAAVAMSLVGVVSAKAASTASITLKSTTSLENRTFEAWEPITVSAVSGDSYTLDIDSTYLSTVTKAAKAAGLTTDGSTVVTDSSSKEDVLSAVSYLGQTGTDADKRTFAEKLLAQLKADSKLATITTGTASGNFVLSADKLSQTASNLTYGWYLVNETTADDPAAPSTTANNSPVSLVMTTPATGDVTINVKSTSPESHKNIVDADYSNQRKAETVNENEDVTYQLTFFVPTEWATQYSNNGFWFTMNDTLDSNLAFGAVQAVKVGSSFDSTTGDTDFNAANGLYAAPTATTVANGDGTTTYTWAFGDHTGTDTTNNKLNLKLAGKWVKLYYTAQVKSGTAEKTGVVNGYDVTYQHNPNSVAGGEKTPTEHAYVYTFNINVLKVDGSDSTALSGAQFEVYADEGLATKLNFVTTDATVTKATAGTYYYVPAATGTSTFTVEVDSTGKLNLRGLKATADGTNYWLKEVKAPNGYRLSNTPIKVTAKAEGFDKGATSTKTDFADQTISYVVNDTADGTVTVKNNKGFLPSTGAAGIVGIVIAGIALIAGGALILRRQRA